jgi:hypothetical protein
MRKFKITVRSDACYISIALGPWPLSNWSHVKICTNNEIEAKAIVEKIKSLSSDDLQYYGFIVGTSYAAITEESARRAMDSHNKSKQCEREYVL